jgi:hypothetical protein
MGITFMGSSVADLEFRRDTLRTRVKQLEESLNHTREIIRKADARRSSEAGNRKWNQVLDNLERGLDEIRGRLAGAKDELEQVCRQLDLARTEGGESLVSMSESVAEDDTLLNMTRASLESMAHMSEELEQETAAEGSDTARARSLEARIEIANQTGSEGSLNSVEGDQRGQQALRAAIAKIQNNQIADMTQQELSMTIHAYNLLSRRVNPSMSDQRLVRILGAAIKVLLRKQAQMNGRA